jgi:DNA polymerase-1
MAHPFENYDDVIAYDFEFQTEGGRHQDPINGRDKGGRQLPLSLATRSLRTGEGRVYWREELLQMRRAPFDTSARTLALTWFGSAEGHCFEALKWKERPQREVDGFAEWRLRRNGYADNKHPSLVDALLRLRLPCTGAAAKEASREEILTTPERNMTLEWKENIGRYNLSDADGTLGIGLKLEPEIDMPRALFRGRYDQVCGVIEHNGVPLDAVWWERFSQVREPLLLRLVQKLDRFQIYDGLTFKQKRFARFLAAARIPWEPTESGKRLLLEDTYFRDQAEIWPILKHLHALRTTISKLKKPALTIGPDGRNRAILGPHGTVTDRNAYSTNQSIFGPDRWTRFTIAPPEGSAFAYIDWSAQEIGIAAFLSGDQRLIATYRSDDPYLYFAKMTGLLSEDAVRGSDEVESMRAVVKILFLGMNYGMSLRGLTWRLGGNRELAVKMWRAHHEAYPVFWRWSDRYLDHADARCLVKTMFGWQMHVVDDVDHPDKSTRWNTIKNWPMQSHGAHMLQIATIALVEAGVKVLFPLHDAFLVEGPERDIVDIAHFTQETMARAGEVMFGVPFRAKPHFFLERRFEDDKPGSKDMWRYVDWLLREIENEQGVLRRAA